MSSPISPQPVKLIVSILTGERELVEIVCKKLTTVFNQIDFLSDAILFDFTSYYEKEIGENLFRHIVSFENLISPDALPSIKLRTNALENELLRQDGARRVNIDPGYITLYHLILATCKKFYHRPYLSDGVYADMTLIFRQGTFERLEWTFPDYGSENFINMLNEIRYKYFQQLKHDKNCSFNTQ